MSHARLKADEVVLHVLGESRAAKESEGAAKGDEKKSRGSFHMLIMMLTLLPTGKIA